MVILKSIRLLRYRDLQVIGTRNISFSGRFRPYREKNWTFAVELFEN